MVCEYRIADRTMITSKQISEEGENSLHVSSNTLVETSICEYTECSSKVLLAIQSLLF